MTRTAPQVAEPLEVFGPEPEAPQAQLETGAVGAEFLRLIPRDFAREHLIISQGREGTTERLAIATTSDPTAVFNVGVRLGVDVEPITADGEAIARLIDEVYGQQESTPGAGAEHVPESEIDRLLATADRDLLSTQGKGPVVKLVDALLFEALSRRASDIHIQPLDGRTLVRYRLDGVLHSVRELPVTATAAVISRVKVMGRMDIAERRMPQDGRATVTIGDATRGRSIDLRISTLPTSYGERAVIRLLDNDRQLCDFDALGMPPDLAERFLHCAQRPNGIILVTGPTGSGKSTTLYSTLRRIASPEVNVMTVEDPIEYELSAVGLTISQSQVNPKKGLTFATGLRHILRQDPDVVMVGEIRDAETARIAIQSSLTGHLVFSTLHTNDAAGAVTRLIDLGVEPYLVSSSLSAILAQRLVRRVHADCGGRGCDDCLRTGYYGRIGLFELMVVDERIRDLVAHGGALAEIRAAAREGGLRTLHQEGQRLISEGRTTTEEVRRVVEIAA